MIVAIDICPQVYSPPEHRGSRLVRAALAIVCCFPLVGFGATSLRMQIDDVVSPQFALKKIDARIVFDTHTAMSLRIGELRWGERVWRDATLECPRAEFQSDVIGCEHAVLDAGTRYPLAFRYLPKTRQLKLTIQPEAQESWRIDLAWGDAWQADIAVSNGAFARLNAAMSEATITFGAGRFDLSAQLAGDRAGLQRWDANLTARDAAFGDSEGRRAGEHLSATAHLRANRDDGWHWQFDATQQAGELFWAPFYFPAASRQVSAAGVSDTATIVLQRGLANFADIGSVRFSGRWDRARQKLATMDVEGTGLAFAGLYGTVIRPLLGESVWARFETSGRLDGHIVVGDGGLQEMQLALRDATLHHQAGLLVLNGVQATIPWRREGRAPGVLQAAGGNVRGIDIGAFQANATIERNRVQVQPLTVPVLDGALVVDELAFERRSPSWQWQFAGALRPISMPQLTAALHWPTMEGALSGVIPRVTYVDRQLKIDGALLARIFDGNVVVKNVNATDPLSTASYVHADIDAKNLDLALLTRQFSFGSITGRLDAEVKGLELSNWHPVAFDGQLSSSPGEYPRKISQRAVESISALGGGSASAAIQRSFLRFFDQFGYNRIGLTCRLAHDVCEMGGIEELAQGYLIVQGGGIPALSVIGYNRRVNWSDLVERLRRATQRGVRPVVK